MTTDNVQNRGKSVMIEFFPIFFYLAMFCILTYPAVRIMRFNLLADDGDGLQNVWNLWWTHQAICVLHQSPWHTAYLHFPYGTTLAGHTLNLFNGLTALFLLPWISFTQTYNVILIASFCATGWTTYLLARRLGIPCCGSLLAGAITAFSSYHFAHAQGHLQLVSFEWVPVFFIFWIAGHENPCLWYAIGSALAFFLVFLCDYYYAFYTLFGALLITLDHFSKPQLSIKRIAFLKPAVVFALISSGLCGPLVLDLFRLAEGGPSGIHPADFFSLDLLAPFVPGGHWRFASLTQPLWSHWSGNIHENSVYLGWSVIGLVAYAWKKRLEWRGTSLNVWFIFLAVFFILALGPFLHINGHIFRDCVLPYKLLEKCFPFLRISGCPIRMMSMVVLASSLIAGAGFSQWLEKHPSKTLVSGLLLFLTLEYWPRPLPATPLEVPGYILALRTATPGAVVDAISTPCWMLFYQTIYQKPLGLGYISRIPHSVAQMDQEVISLYQQGRFGELHARYGFRYFLLPSTAGMHELCLKSKNLYDDGRVFIADFAP